jgi:hypothetical protein
LRGLDEPVGVPAAAVALAAAALSALRRGRGPAGRARFRGSAG